MVYIKAVSKRCCKESRPFCWVNPLAEISDMVSVVACHARDSGSNLVGLERDSPWNYMYLNGGNGNSVRPELASGER